MGNIDKLWAYINQYTNPEDVIVKLKGVFEVSLDGDEVEMTFESDDPVSDFKQLLNDRRSTIYSYVMTEATVERRFTGHGTPSFLTISLVPIGGEQIRKTKEEQQ